MCTAHAACFRGCRAGTRNDPDNKDLKEKMTCCQSDKCNSKLEKESGSDSGSAAVTSAVVIIILPVATVAYILHYE